MAEYDHIRELFNNYLDNRISEEELGQLVAYFDIEGNREQLTSLIREEMSAGQATDRELVNTIADKVEQRIFPAPQRRSNVRALYWVSAAAAAILLFSTITFLLQKQYKDQKPTAIARNTDVLPGGQKAILILSGGEKIDLASAHNGTIASQGGSIVTKTADGKIDYTTGKNTNDVLAYNTIITPRGGEYRLQLPDGSLVWLNADSRLKYPTSFATQKERVVELSGEAYFEVAHNRDQPFLVKAGTQTVQVLGTHFNVMAYSEEEASSTTLLEGSVKVSSGTNHKTIKPGEQAVVADAITVNDADVDAVTAWKNGRTYFKDADIKTIMRSLSRWYNIDVEYRGEPGKELFTGGISRKSKLSGLLKILAAGDIHAKVENGKLVVKP